MILTHPGRHWRRPEIQGPEVAPWASQPPRAARGRCFDWARQALPVLGDGWRIVVGVAVQGGGDEAEVVQHFLLEHVDGSVLDPSAHQFRILTAVYAATCPDRCGACGAPYDAATNGIIHQRHASFPGEERPAGAQLVCGGDAIYRGGETVDADVIRYLRRWVGRCVWADAGYRRPYTMGWLPHGS